MPNTSDHAQKAPRFYGAFRPLLDEKGRLTIPSKWRADGALTDLYLVKSPTRGCVTAFTEESLQKWGERATENAPTMEDGQLYIDQLFASALPCPVDSQGRMVLADDLRKFAGIKRDTVLTGSGDKFDIWTPEAWDRQQTGTSTSFAAISKSIGL